MLDLICSVQNLLCLLRRVGSFLFCFVFSCGIWSLQMQHVGIQFLTWDRTWAPCIGSAESQPLDHQEVSVLIINYVFLVRYFKMFYIISLSQRILWSTVILRGKLRHLGCLVQPGSQSCAYWCLRPGFESQCSLHLLSGLGPVSNLPVLLSLSEK